MANSIQTNSATTERRERIKRDWAKFASKQRQLKDQEKQTYKENLSRIPDNQELELWKLWRSVTVIATVEEKLTALIAISARQYGKIYGKHLNKERKRFNKIKHRILSLRNAECFVCGAPASIRHHVIQMHHGGESDPLNLIPLCYPCHGQIHPWIT